MSVGVVVVYWDKQKTEYEVRVRLVGSERGIRDRVPNGPGFGDQRPRPGSHGEPHAGECRSSSGTGPGFCLPGCFAGKPPAPKIRRCGGSWEQPGWIAHPAAGRKHGCARFGNGCWPAPYRSRGRQVAFVGAGGPAEPRYQRLAWNDQGWQLDTHHRGPRADSGQRWCHHGSVGAG